MSSFAWYLKRLRTFSPAEIFYRFGQQFRYRMLDRREFQNSPEQFSPKIKPQFLGDSAAHLAYPIFDSEIDILKPLDWHRDVSAGKIFPKQFAHSIDIRSDRFGSAKHVWEVNRHLFLVHLSELYRKSGDFRYAEMALFHLESWISENPFLCGVNWYSNIEINIRLINWAYCWKLLDVPALCKKNSAVDEFVRKRWLPSIREHADYSFKHPSKYSSANNHLISEYAGLFVACCTWELPHCNSRLAYAQKGLEREILKQNSPDGVNLEEAAEYIQFIDDFFLIAAIVGENSGHKFSEKYLERLHKIAEYLNSIVDCAGNYPMYGDGDDGFVLRTDAARHFNNFTSLLSAFAAFFGDGKLKRSSATWNDKCELLLGEKGRKIFEALPCDGNVNDFSACKNGHFLFRKGSGAREIYLHFDAAPLGFLSIAAHGHADALSFILHVDGCPIFVDPGTFTYHTHREWRKYFVGTLAHNTARICGKDQATLAGPTMWLEHFHAQILDGGKDFICASHDGYKKFGIVHKRTLRVESENEFEIIDEILSEKPFELELPFHLHPNVKVAENGRGYILTSPGARPVEWIPDEKLSYRTFRGETAPILGWYSEYFGEKVPTTVLYAKKRCEESSVFRTRVRVMEDRSET